MGVQVLSVNLISPTIIKVIKKIKKLSINFHNKYYLIKKGEFANLTLDIDNKNCNKKI